MPKESPTWSTRSWVQITVNSNLANVYDKLTFLKVVIFSNLGPTPFARMFIGLQAKIRSEHNVELSQDLKDGYDPITSNFRLNIHLHN